MASSSSNIPLEIIEIILSKLSAVKSLLRFKTVCKSWNTIISDPVFVRNHLENSPNNLFLSTKRPRIEGGYPLYKLDGRKFHVADAVPAPRTNSKYSRHETVLCECNGILLLRNSRFHYSEKHLLWNPSTRREMYFECPYPYSGTCAPNYGLCYDRLTDDFKVVLIADKGYAIYSCKNNSWSEKKLGIEYRGFFEGVFVDGATYWVLSDEILTTQVVYFDPRIDELKCLQKPEQLEQMINDSNGNIFISVACLRENMCLYGFSDDCMLKFRIWRKEKGIDVGGNPNWEELIIFENRNTLDWCAGVLCFDENKIVIRLHGTTFVYYSPYEKTFEEIGGTVTNIFSNYCSQLFRYRDSLYFPVQTETRSIS